MKKREHELMIINNRRKELTSKKFSSTDRVLKDKDKINSIRDPTQPFPIQPNPKLCIIIGIQITPSANKFEVVISPKTTIEDLKNIIIKINPTFQLSLTR